MGDKIKVLAVDDAPANLMILKGCLRGDDFELVTSSNALDALQKFKDQYFDIVLLDVIMPGIDGFELRKLIREVDAERPIIFLTAMVDDGNMTMLNQISWDSNTYYLNKIINKKILIQKITEVVNVQRTRQMDRLYSRKLESELKLAGDLQRILLPKWAMLEPSVDFSSLYAPAMQVSGDIFEMIRLDDGRYLVFIGDIAGHGISAALYMSTVQAFLKIKAHEKNFAIHTLLSELNRFFCEDLRGTTYMTALVGLVDFEKNRITLHSAGHPGLLIGSPKDQSIRFADKSKGGLPLGWFLSAEYPEENNVDFDFDEDSIFLGATDGVFDMENDDGATMTEEEFQELVKALLVDTDAMIFPYRLRSTLEQMGYTHAPDDFTFIAFQKRQHRPRFLERLIPAELPNVNKTAVEFSAITDDLRQLSQIELCVHEFLNNVIVHGNKGLGRKQDLIYISIEEKDGHYVIRGLDRGKVWDPTAAMQLPQEESNSLATSGRGIQILQNITDYVSYNSYCGLNETCFVLKNGE